MTLVNDFFSQVKLDRRIRLWNWNLTLQVDVCVYMHMQCIYTFMYVEFFV